MNQRNDKTVVQRPADATQVQVSNEDAGKTVVAGMPGLDSAGAKVAARSASEGMVLKQRFELVEQLGSGGMGAVFKARDLRQVEAGDADPWVAVKVINESFCRHEHALVSLQQETKKTQRLSHPNIVSAYDFDRDGDVAFMTMELLQGQSLDQLLRKHKTGLSQSRALHILRQITDAIIYAHQQGVVHADLKPANIFITQTGQVKVLDFGIARAIYAESTALDVSSIQAFTPAYASVNVLCGAKPQQQDDLYALGCIFYMLFTGEHPYKRCKATEADAAMMKVPRIGDLTRAQWKALSLLLAFNPQTDLTIEGFRQRFFGESSRRPRQLALISSAALILLVTGFFLLNWVSHREHRAVESLLAQPDFKSVQKGTLRLNEFNKQDTLVILQSARDAVLHNLGSQMQGLKSADDFQRVSQLFDLLMPLYADSSALQDLQSQFNRLRDAFLSQLAGDIEQIIESRDYQTSQPDFQTLISDLQTVEPSHPLFERYDFKHLLAKEAGLAVYLGQQAMAEAIVAQASGLFPNEASRFQAILTRQGQGSSVQADSLGSNSDSTAWLQEYREAVALAQQQRLESGDDVSELMHKLQQDNPAMYGVLKASLRHFYQDGDVQDLELLAWKKQWLPVRSTAVAVKRYDPCRAQSRCRDQLAPNVQGPELVVIKGLRAVPGFAVSRTEVTIADYNHYCRMFRACSLRAGAGLPITDISFQQAQNYVAWLSKMSGHQYRIPTLQQWKLMAKDDSGIRDHNCKVYAGGRWVRGGSLRSAAEGYQNSLGLQNLFGNAGEWVRDGSNLLTVGGDASTELDGCSAAAITQGAPDGGPLHGFRVVRTL
ncbi:bifunctional serine/threonine-protein kinase/formylglycine-generating enzyme family protein [Ketobacter alkanivorans]|uniref:Protein kinase domain-containing protein n=1 Tax=Ketobacter alkanivorans TaxID=1917421 RepID=A0A2K9LPU0_9GAMM|nr:bifunctional serine/threonine-protein kinase/formylglycine-generating enzyme family protein [Ketobacter alkanivorans]AUM14338.1 hypothetical protein Kalk_18740 [Ketobacter alkanivorans]